MAGTDDSDIPESGAVFTFGKSKFANNVPNKFWVRGDAVRQISCGDEHTALVAESGRIFVFGPNDWGQLGTGSSSMSDKPTCIKSLKTEKVKSVACGRSHTIVATESGKVYTFGSNSEGQLGVDDIADSGTPVQVSSFPETPVAMVAAGADHSVALTEDGRVFVWGGGSEGQLGLGEETDVPTPKLLPLEEKATCIACGYYHTAVITENGKLYTFGESEGGKLGLGDSDDATDVPQQVTMLAPVKQVACGHSHTILLTADGEVYSCGLGENGQLGRGTQHLESDTPQLLKLGFRVSSISCGENHTALVSERSQLFTFGDGRHGKLALGQETFANQFTPCRVSRFSNFIVSQVSCGGCHMIILAKPKVQNGDVESDDEDEEVAVHAQTINHTLKANDLEGSLSARLRRRQTNLQNSAALPNLNQTLPPRGGGRPLEPLHATLPNLGNKTAPLAKPRSLPTPEAAPKKEEESSEEEESRGQPKPLPRGSPAKSAKVVPVPTPRKSKAEGDVADSEESETETADAKDKKKKDKKKKEMSILGKKKEASEAEKEEEEKEKLEDGEEEEEEEDDKKEKAGKKDKKSKNKKKEKGKDKKKKKDKKGKKDEEEEDGEDEEEKKEKNSKDKKKKDKKEKGKEKEKDKEKDKKKKDKNKEEEKEEEEEEDDEEEGDGDKKSKNDKDEDSKKNGKADKDGKKDKKEEGKDGSGDHAKDDKDKEEAKKEEEKKEEEKKEEEKKEEAKKEEKPKKSRTCSIL